jgi:hypothetical protein
VPSVRHIARVKLSLDPMMRRSGKPPHHLGIQSYGFLGRIFTPVVYIPKLKIPKKNPLPISRSEISVSLVKF